MEYVITGQEPAQLFRFFEEISAIPRSSGHERAVSDFVMGFAAARGLWARQDFLYNVVVKKPGSPGREKLPAVLLQGHLDMVCEQNAESRRDFFTQGIELEVADGFLRARGTTLGADNGIAVAMMMAVLDDATLIHPPLECVFTVGEEVGLLGALALDATELTARTMINLDSEEEGVVTVSCSGGARVGLSAPCERMDGTRPGLCITVEGLRGGHSGMDIGEERGNANVLMGRLLAQAGKCGAIALERLEGGGKDNAIPRECVATLAADHLAAVQSVVEQWGEALREELASCEPGLSITVQPAEVSCPLSGAQSRRIVDLLNLTPNGVLTRDMEAGGFVVASSNLASIRVGEQLECVVSLRSSVESLLQHNLERMGRLAKLLGLAWVVNSRYPGWSYAPRSPLRQLLQECWREQSGQELRCEAIHAGLECGIFCGKLPGLDAVAIGPNLYDVHTPAERLELASCGRVYALLTKVLAGLSK